MSKASQWALAASGLLGGGYLLKELAFNRKKPKSLGKLLGKLALYGGLGAGAGYLLNKGLSNYIYNSVKLNPYSYEPEYILSYLRPVGDTLREKTSDIWKRLTTTPDLDDVKVLPHSSKYRQFESKPKVNAQGVITETDKQPNIGQILSEYNFDPEEIEKDKSLAPGEKIAFKEYANGLPYRRELLARYLGIFDPSKGSLFKEIPYKEAEKSYDKTGILAKLPIVNDTVLVPKDHDKFFGSMEGLDNLDRNTGKTVFGPGASRPALANVLFGFNPSLNALNIGDVWDFRVNDATDIKDTKRIYGNKSYWMRKLITSLFEDKAPIILGLKQYKNY